MLEASCYRYISHVLHVAPMTLAVPLCRYVSSIPSGTLYSVVIVVERPYFTDIYPDYFSAMSYHEEYSGPTPATSGAGRLVSQFSKATYDQVEEWFRDSWMYLAHGVLLLNVCCSRKFVDASSIEE